ncbi:MarR family winged helix-turn-helix transcriptional regulator [Schinkia azotoformans]|uniref:MarR family winged helix-turn-helix transcriptional regulator n=1 Tax=Schinkia azotoformans TaxID=1454 RepID=UPI0009E055FE|nr:MarR family transcriptional regulator [Schinkia azotoformans]MEC1694912.1 MarR family transcriptional regulator [Schinkia azotoformans]MEC1716219.1 MarR family transcriptional regulator [Schinkia azotoformans]MEC1725523.1 MarR family transcriptional regulator [Schinkia azotoformans]MEC1770690.1 MarR family transcriptional regulator [Schinkia azotoformans]MEC1778138.1 MarR family transcriptional regulator [Schinkia azotoformans]
MYRPFENRLNVHLAEHQLYRAQWTILYYLANNGTATLVELSHYMSVEKPTVTRTMTRLEELGYVEHVVGKDKREKRMQLSAAGQKIYQDIRVTIDQFEQEILEGITEKEQIDAIRIMGIIRDNITNKGQ